MGEKTRATKRTNVAASASLLTAVLSFLFIFLVTQVFSKFWMKSALHASLCGFLCSLLFVFCITVCVIIVIVFSLMPSLSNFQLLLDHFKRIRFSWSFSSYGMDRKFVFDYFYLSSYLPLISFLFLAICTNSSDYQCSCLCLQCYVN